VTDRLTYRAAEVAGVNERTITLLVAPYEAPANLGGGVTEVITRGAFGDVRADRLPLKLETGHGHAGPVVGRAVSVRDEPDGLYATFRVSETRDGDDALTLAADGALGASAGMILGDLSPRPDGTVAVRAAELREVTLTGTPAYVETAAAMAVRSTDTEEPTMDTNTPAVDETAANDTPDVTTLVDEAVTRALDAYRAEAAAAATPTITEATHRGHAYRSVGDVMADAIAHARGSDPTATDRLTRSIDAGVVASDGSAIRLAARDVPGFTPPAEAGNSIGSGVASGAADAYIPDLLELLREGRPVADLFESRPLPMIGNNVNFPAVSVGNTVAFQDGQNTKISVTRQDQILTTWPKGTLAGGQGVSIQAQQWTDPNYMESVIRDLLADHAEYLDGQTINGDPAVSTPVSSTGFTGILTAGATDVPVGGDAVAAVALVGTAWAAVYAGSRRAPRAAMMNSDTWGAFLNAVDSDGRPIVTTEAPQNPAGFGDAASIAGTLRGVPVVVDENVPAGDVIMGSFRDAVLMESGAAEIALTFPSVLQTDVAIYSHAALAIRRPAAFAVLSGITT